MRISFAEGKALCAKDSSESCKVSSHWAAGCFPGMQWLKCPGPVGWDPAPGGTGHCCSLCRAARETTGFALRTLFWMLPVVMSSRLYQQGLWSSLASSRCFVLLSCHEAQKLLFTITLSAGTHPLLATSLLGVVMSFSVVIWYGISYTFFDLCLSAMLGRNWKKQPLPWQAVWMLSLSPEWQHGAVHAVYQSVTCD